MTWPDSNIKAPESGKLIRVARESVAVRKVSSLDYNRSYPS
jgi:hypothetical protein